MWFISCLEGYNLSSMKKSGIPSISYPGNSLWPGVLLEPFLRVALEGEKWCGVKLLLSNAAVWTNAGTDLAFISLVDRARLNVQEWTVGFRIKQTLKQQQQHIFQFSFWFYFSWFKCHGHLPKGKYWPKGSTQSLHNHSSSSRSCAHPAVLCWFSIMLHHCLRGKCC